MRILPFSLVGLPLYFLLLFFGMLSAPVMAAENTEIRVGLMAPLTGKWASEGEDARRVLSLLVEQCNNSGMLGPYRLKLEVQDDAGDPRNGALAAQKLLNLGVVAIMGAYGSSVAEAVQHIIDEAGVVHLSSGATSVRLTEKGLQGFFRVGPRDDGQSRMAAQYIAQQGFKAVAIIHDNTSHPRGFAEESRIRLREQGVPVVFYDALTPGQRDYTVLLDKVHAAQPDVILYTGYYPETGLLLRQKADMRWGVPMLGGDASNHQDLVHIAGKRAAYGYSFISAALPQDLDTPQARAFLQAYVEKYGSPPLSVWSLLIGDGLLALAQGVAGGALTADALRENLHALHGPSASTGSAPIFSALTGSVSFDAKGDREGDLYRLYKVDAEGRFTPQELRRVPAVSPAPVSPAAPELSVPLSPSTTPSVAAPVVAPVAAPGEEAKP